MRINGFYSWGRRTCGWFSVNKWCVGYHRLPSGPAACHQGDPTPGPPSHARKRPNQRSMLLNAWGMLLSAWALSIHGSVGSSPWPCAPSIGTRMSSQIRLQSPQSKIIDLAACILTQKKHQVTTKLGKDTMIVMLRIDQELSNPDSLLNEQYWTLLFPNKSGSRMTMGCLGSHMVRGTTKHVIWTMVEIANDSPLWGDGCKPTNSTLCECPASNNYDQPSTNQDSATSM